MFYSELPILAIGPLHIGAKKAENVGKCGDGTHLVKAGDDVECRPGQGTQGTAVPVAQYYSRLPDFGIGPWHVGAELAKGVGRCAAGTELTGGICTPASATEEPESQACDAGFVWLDSKCEEGNGGLAAGSGIKAFTDGSSSQFAEGYHNLEHTEFENSITKIAVADGCRARVWRDWKAHGDSSIRGDLLQPRMYRGGSSFGSGVFQKEQITAVRVHCGPGVGPLDCGAGGDQYELCDEDADCCSGDCDNFGRCKAGLAA